MRGLWVAVLLIGAAFAWSSPVEAQEAPAQTVDASAEQAFYNFLIKDQMARRPTTAKDFRSQVQDACGEYPLRPSGSAGGDSVQGRNGSTGICAVMVLACGACSKGKPAFIVNGVEGIVVGPADMAVNNKMLTRGFGRLFRVMGELCADYYFTTFAENFVKPADKLNDSDYFVVGVFGAKEFGSEMRPGKDRGASGKSIVPGRYFDPYEYRARCRKAG